MTAPRILTAAELATAKQMRGANVGLQKIADKLGVSRNAVERALGRLKPRQEDKPRDMTSCLPIGKLPPDHPLYPLDQEIMRQRALVRRWR